MTDGEIKQIKNSNAYKRFIASGDSDKAERLILHGYILTSMGIYMIEEANDLMQKHGLFKQSLKHTANDFSRAFDQHSRIMQSFFPGLPEKEVFCNAIDKIRPNIDALVTSGVLQSIGNADGEVPTQDVPGNAALHSPAINDQIAYGHIPDNDKN